jgi:hypothetical protein
LRAIALQSKKNIGLLSVAIAGMLLGVFLKVVLPVIWRRPVALIEPAVFDFGEVGTSQMCTAVFRVRNEGRAPLHVQLLKANCTCTIAEMCDNPILPAQQSLIKVYMKAPEMEAHFGSEIAVKTNDSRRSMSSPCPKNC